MTLAFWLQKCIVRLRKGVGLCLRRKKHILSRRDIGIAYQMVEFSVTSVRDIAGFTQANVASALYANGRTSAWC